MSRTVSDVQMEFAQINGYSNEIFWDLLSANQSHILKDKIKNLIPDQPPDEKNVKLSIANNEKLEELRSNLFRKIWDQRKYTNRNSLTSIFYVLVADEKTQKSALASQQYSCHPVFRTRKCVAEDDSTKCCMIFIDETGRVYKNWSDYVHGNVLPKGIMVAPKNGYYTFDENNRVNLDFYITPAARTSTKVLEGADKTAAVTGFVAAGVSIAAVLSAPVAAPIVALASFGGLVSASYAGVRAGSNLHDRNTHDESISLRDRQARASWLGVMGGFIGLGATGATRVLTSAAAAGKEVSAITTFAVNGMNISSIVISGSGVANGILDMILKSSDGEEITTMDVLQLAASLVLFTHSVNNFQLASKIVADTRNNKINSYREGLSNRQRRMFDKITKETIRIKGPKQGRIDVIRSVNEIPSKQYLNDLHKINRQLNKQKVRPSFGGADKPVLLNNDLPVDTTVLRNNVQHSKGPDVLSQVKQPIPESYKNTNTKNILNNTRSNIPAPGRLLLSENVNDDKKILINTSNTAKEPTKGSVAELMKENFPTGWGAVLNFAQLGASLFKHVNNVDSMKDIVTKMAHNYTEPVFEFVIKVVNNYIENTLEFIEDRLGVKIPRELVLKRVQMFLNKYKNITVEFLKDKQLEITSYLSSFFKSEEALECIEASNNGNVVAGFIFSNPEASNDSVESLMDANVQLACGPVVPLKDFDREFFQHILNMNSFKDIIMSMAEKFPKDIFRFMLDLTQKFISTELQSIQNLLRTPVATDAILFRIFSHCLKAYEDLNYTFLLDKSAEILKIVKDHFLELNPNYAGNRTKCPNCSGYYSIRNI